MHWIYLSPHLDDAALSCGGLIWEQTHAGERVTVLTVCAGIPDPAREPLSPFAQELHARWGAGPEAAAIRQAEDVAACRVLGAAPRHLPLLDCIYRTGPDGQHIYASEQALNGPLHPYEAARAARLSRLRAARLPRNAQVVCPLGLGNHVDHQLTRLAAEQLGRPLWYYADYPYVLKHPAALDSLAQTGWRRQLFPIRRAGLTAWQDSVAAYTSQISTFWADQAAMRFAIEEYASRELVVYLWQKGSGSNSGATHF